MRAYPLAMLLAVREREVAARLASVARALAAVDRRRADLRSREAAVAAQVERARDAARGVAAGAGGPGELAARARWADRLRAELPRVAAARTAAAAAVDAAERELRGLLDATAAARAALRAVEVHRDGWRAAQARARDLREQDAADDLVSARRGARWRAPPGTRS